MKSRMFVLMLVCLTWSGAMAQTKKGYGSGPPIGHPDPAVNLAMGRWVFVTVLGNAISPISWPQPYVKFDANIHKVTGNTGCQRFRGTYQAHGKTLSIRADGVATVPCRPGHYEKEVLQVLRTVTQYSIKGDELRLEGPEGVLGVLLRPHQEQTGLK